MKNTRHPILPSLLVTLVLFSLPAVSGCVEMQLDEEGQASIIQPDEPERFVTHGDLVTDHDTGYVWQRTTGSGDFGSAATYCDNLVIQGHRSFRLPTEDEALSLAPAGNELPFATATAWFWTGVETSDTQAIAVDLDREDATFDVPQSISFAVRCIAYERFTVDGGLVFDEDSGRVWQRYKGSGDHDTAAAYCDNLVIQGHSDFRLPTEDEALFLAPLGNDLPFSTATSWFWTSTEPSTDTAIVIDLDREDFTYEIFKTEVFAVRCVEYERFTVDGDLVLDHDTGRVWQRTGGVGNFATAASYCQNLDIQGFRNFRLPTLEEAQALAPLGNNQPFLRIPALYWTSNEPSASTATVIDLGGQGVTYDRDQTWSNGLRCIRDGV